MIPLVQNRNNILTKERNLFLLAAEIIVNVSAGSSTEMFQENCTENCTFNLAIAILVNWFLLKGILTQMACYPIQNTHGKKGVKFRDIQ